jgi:predicted RNase H-like HicB family nuclease
VCYDLLLSIGHSPVYVVTRSLNMTTMTLEYWQDEAWFVGRLREVPGCFSQGATVEELESNIREVYGLLRADEDLPIPPNTMTKSLLIAA